MGYDDEDEPEDDFLPLDDDDEAEGSELDTSADVTCPYCGENMTIALDPSGGAEQDYVEDCEVCCRPWRVHVHYDDGGAADVTLEGS